MPTAGQSPPHAAWATRGDCSGQTFGELARQWDAFGAVVVTPCSLQRGGLLDAAEAFTLAEARKVLRRRGQGCQGAHERVETCQFGDIGLSQRKAIQDGMMNMWRGDWATHDVATDREVRELIQFLHDGRRPAPFQTKNWYLGSMVPTHADVIFHDSWPTRGLLVGTWLALEDVSPHAGPLVYFNGSHTQGGLWDFEALNLTGHSPNATRLADPYQTYSRTLHELVRRRGMRSTMALLKRGQMLIWRGNVLHGGAQVVDWNLTRLAITTHYFVEGAKRFWNPLTSAGAGAHIKASPPWIGARRQSSSAPGAPGAAGVGRAAVGATQTDHEKQLVEHHRREQKTPG